MARTHGMSLRAVHAEPAAWVLWSWMEIEDDRRIQDGLAHLHALERAHRAALAFHAPDRVADEHRAELRRLAPVRSARMVADPESVARAAMDIFAWSDGRAPKPVS